jgi:hypothetical protein
MCRYIGTDISAADIRCIGNADISAFFADILPIYRQLTLTNISASFADISAKIEKRRDFYAGFHITA